MTTGPNFYDVLDVDRTAGTDEIRDAWRAAIADLTPADRRFRLFNQAAEVLLDPEQRAAYDAELAGQETPSATPAGTEREPGEPARTRVAAGTVAALPSVILEKVRRSGRSAATGAAAVAGDRRVPTWLLAGVAVLTVASLALTGYLFTQPSPDSVEEAGASARSAAERAVVPVLSYDYRTLDEDQAAAHEWLTSDQEEDYDELFEVLKENAPSTRTVVDVEVVPGGSAIVRAGEERSEILLFVNRPTTNKSTKEPIVYKDQVTLTMERVDGEWLVDGLRTSPVAS